MSQNSQSSSFTYVSLPLLKFSHASVAEGTSAPIPWKHVTANADLCLVLDAVDTPGPAGAIERRQRLQVFHGPTTQVSLVDHALRLATDGYKETIDLDILASEAQKAIMRAQTTYEQRATPVITVIAKLPCLAMRYPLSGARVRRFQVRFADAEGFYETMKRLSIAGVPVTEAHQGVPMQIPKVQAETDQSMIGWAQYPGRRPATASGHEYSRGSQNEPCTRSAPMRENMRPATSGPGHTHQPTSVGQHLWHSNPPQPPPSLLPLPLHASPPAASMKDQHIGYHSNLIRQHETMEIANPICVPSSMPEPSTIDLYQPKPSLIPFSTQTRAEDVMPPRRELPFVRKASRIGLELPTPELGCSNIVLAPQAKYDEGTSSKTNSASIEHLEPTIHEIDESMTGKGKKRTASKADKPPAPKRSKSSNPRKKPDTKPDRQIDAVPSVEELLKGMSTPKKAQIVNPTLLDTQVLINQAEAKLAASRSSKSTPDHTVSDANELVKEHLKDAGTRDGTARLNDNETKAHSATNSEYTQADDKQQINLSTSKTNTSPVNALVAVAAATSLPANHNDKIIKKQHKNPTAKRATKGKRSQTSTSIAESSQPTKTQALATDPQPDITFTAVTHADNHQQPNQNPITDLPSSISKILASNPNLTQAFTQAINSEPTKKLKRNINPREKPNKHSDRDHDTIHDNGDSENNININITTNHGDETDNDNDNNDDMHRLLETWMCEQIDNEEFLELCKLVDGVWGRIFVRF